MDAVALGTTYFARFHEGTRNIIRVAKGVYFVGVDGDADPEAIAVLHSTYGDNWAEKDASNRPVVAAGNIIGCSVAVDSSGVLHILFYDEGNQFSYTTFDTASDQYNSGSAASIEQVAAEDRGPILTYWGLGITIDSSDIPHVSFIDGTKKKGTVYNTIYYTNRIGGTWKAAVYVRGADEQSSQRSPEITVNASDIPLIVHTDLGGVDQYASKGDVINATAFTWKLVDSTVDYAQKCSIAVDSNGDCWIAYIDDDADVNLAKQSANWTDAWTIVLGPSAGQPSLAIDGTDIWVWYRNLSSNIICREYTGSWQTPVTLESNTFYNPLVRWAYNNNYSYSAGMDYVFKSANNVYYNRYGGQEPPSAWNPMVMMITGILGMVALKIISFLKIIMEVN